jgi:hypothetical protein
MMNVYSSYTDTYLYIVTGIEMIQFFKFTNPIFTSSIFYRFYEEDFVMLIMFIIFCICVLMNIMKLIYEMNLKLQIAVLLLSLVHETINIALIIMQTTLL